MESKIKFKPNPEYRLIDQVILQVIFYACFSFAYHSLSERLFVQVGVPGNPLNRD